MRDYKITVFKHAGKTAKEVYSSKITIRQVKHYLSAYCVDFEGALQLVERGETLKLNKIKINKIKT